MRAMRAEQFSGYEGLKRVDLRKSAISDGKVLLRVTAVGVTPLEHTILSGQFPLAKAPLVLDSEGGGRSGGRRWNEVPCRFTCDVHWDVWRFRGWSLRRVARRVRGQQGGVRGLTKTAALELGHDNIRVNSIHPVLFGRRSSPIMRRTPRRWRRRWLGQGRVIGDSTHRRA